MFFPFDTKSWFSLFNPSFTSFTFWLLLFVCTLFVSQLSQKHSKIIDNFLQHKLSVKCWKNYRFDHQLSLTCSLHQNMTYLYLLTSLPLWFVLNLKKLRSFNLTFFEIFESNEALFNAQLIYVNSNNWYRIYNSD